jgi:nucleoside 2-deoxyribosyltransferase
MLIYVAGKYSGANDSQVKDNIRNAALVASRLWEKGHAAICPHTNTSQFELIDCTATYEQYLQGDLKMLARCDAIVMVPGWEESRGAVTERLYAVELGIPVFEYPSLPDLHPTEMKSPTQAKAFMEILGRMYRTHLQKNADYSPANILATGEVGLVTRLWDKTARLLNLMGFKFEIEEAGYYTAPSDPKNESIEDTYMDLAVYAIIGLLLKKGIWGR